MKMRQMTKLAINQAIIVEGRDDVAAVSQAVDALIIPTHGFGITKETWQLVDKAYAEKGIIILTDPDYSGEEIRRKLTERCREAIQAYISQEDATAAGDIGVENASPEVIAAAIKQALSNSARLESSAREFAAVTMSDLVALGLTGSEGATELRQKVCAKLGIGYGNGKAMVKKLAHWGIGIKELEQTVKETQRASE